MGRKKKNKIVHYRKIINPKTGRISRVKYIENEPAKKRVRSGENQQKKYTDLRRAVMRRDKNKCVRCGFKKRLQVHHKVRRSEGGKDEYDNLITLCDICHMEEHRDEVVYNIMIKSFWIYEDILKM